MDDDLHKLNTIEEYENEGFFKIIMELLLNKLLGFKILPLTRFQMKKTRKRMHIIESLERT